MTGLETSNAYGFKATSSPSANISNLKKETVKQERPQKANNIDVEEFADKLFSAFLAKLEPNIETDVQVFSNNKSIEMAYLRTLEAYLHNQLLQVQDRIQNLSTEGLD